MISTLTWSSAATAARGPGAAGVSSSEKVSWLLTGGHPTAWRHTPPLDQQLQQLAENKDFRLGLTKVFIKEPRVLLQLERDRRLAVTALTTRVQALVRGAPQAKRYRHIRHGFILSQAKIRCFLRVKHYKQTLIDIVRLQCLLRKFIERCRYRKLFAQFRGQPPRMYALQLQKVARRVLANAHMRRTNSSLFASLQLIRENIRTAVARRAAQIKIAKNARRQKERKVFLNMRAAQIMIASHARGRQERRLYFKKKMAANRIRVSEESPQYILTFHANRCYF